ncbi:MAG TPA: hypothetical protein VFY17_11435 [Pilimelia sp.]|nr:hypothetical protein [Pilimelia sp.]
MTSSHPAARRRAAALLVALGVAVGVLTGCGGTNSDTNCNLSSCTVTFRGVDASASVLGVEAKVVRIQGEQVTMSLGGQEATLSVGQQAVDLGGFQVTLQSADADEIVVLIAKQ